MSHIREVGTGWSSNPKHSMIYHWQPLWWLRASSSFMGQQWNHLEHQIFTSISPWLWGMFPGGILCFWDDGLGAFIKHNMMCLPELGSKAQHSLTPPSPHSSFAGAWSLHSSGFGKTASNTSFLLSLHSFPSRDCWVWSLQQSTLHEMQSIKTESAGFSCWALTAFLLKTMV